MRKVVTRFAPSPTGYLHIGGARTAIFAFLYARHFDGKFVLRIEDTDRERSTQESIDAILEGMEWLGLGSDEEPVFQSARADRYLATAMQLEQQGQAYRCYCSKERLTQLREEQLARGEKPRYDGRCRELETAQSGPYTLRLRTQREGSVVFSDLVHGEIEVANSELDDLILLRTDRSATYNFAVVVDDADMGISHVIRGDDHINNTPRQLHVFEALGLHAPEYAHVPMILGPDGSRLSKRHGAVSVLQYRDDGYLPDALVNYLVRLGWAHKDQEIFTRDELVGLFDLKDVNRAAAHFDPEKLRWLNQQYMQKESTERLGGALARRLRERGISADDPDPNEVAKAFRERAHTLNELADQAHFLYTDAHQFDPAAAKKHLRPVAADYLRPVREALASLEPWNVQALGETLQRVADDLDVGFGKIGQPLRVAITGRAAAPSNDMVLALLGRDRALARVDQALELIAERAASA